MGTCRRNFTDCIRRPRNIRQSFLSASVIDLRRLFALGAALVWITAGAGCGEKKRTEIILGIATDLDAPSPLRSIQLKVFREGVVLTDQTIAISGLTTEPFRSRSSLSR